MTCTLLIGGLFGISVLSLTLTIGLITFYQFYHRPDPYVPSSSLLVDYEYRLNRIRTLICGIITGIVWLWADTSFMLVEAIVKYSLLESGLAGIMGAFLIPMNFGAIMALGYMLIFRQTIYVPTEHSAFLIVEGALLGGLGASVPTVLYLVTFPWFYFFSLTGAFIVGGRAENALSGISPDVPHVIYAYQMGSFIGGIIGGIILGSGLGLLSTGIFREILGKKTWQWGAHNLWGLVTGLSVGVIYSTIFVWIYVVNMGLVPLGRYLTEAQVAQWVSIFCLPTDLPESLDPYPIFYKTGDPSIPDVAVLYKDKVTSEQVFIIVMDDVSETNSVKIDGEYDAYNPVRFCKAELVLSNGLHACYKDWSNEPIRPNSNESRFEGPAFITTLGWQVQRDRLVTLYTIKSSLSVEETEPIAASMCSE